MVIGETNGFGVRRSEDADHSEPIRCKVALEVFCPVKVQAPAFVAESLRNELWRDRFREQPLHHDILSRQSLIVEAVVL